MKVKQTLIFSMVAGILFSIAGCNGNNEMVKSEIKYPSENAIRLTKMAPKQVILNEPFNYNVRVENLTDSQLDNVTIKDAKPDHMQINSSDPQPETDEQGAMVWNIGTLRPKETRMISINATATEMIAIDTCANVSFDRPTCAFIDIVDTRLTVAKQMPSEALQCERIPVSYLITNEGTATARNIMVEDTLPNGMITSEGSNRLLFTIEELEPGECQEIKTTVDATQTGRFASGAVATSPTGGQINSNVSETVITKPELSISQTCPADQNIGRNVTYEITLSNNGDGVARDTMVAATVPANAKYRSASEGGQFMQTAPRCVTWNVGELQPDSSKVLTMTVDIENPGRLESRTTANAFCAEEVSDTCTSEISGIPGISLEVVDVSDPIEVGGTQTYIITVTNQGSATDRNIEVGALLDENMQYISSTGPTRARTENGEIRFENLDTLNIGETAIWRVNVRATGEGYSRFRVRMNSEELNRFVESTEPTNFYQTQ